MLLEVSRTPYLQHKQAHTTFPSLLVFLAYTLFVLLRTLSTRTPTIRTHAQAEFCLTSEAPGGIGGRLQSYAGLDGDMYLRGGGGAAASGVLNTGQPVVRSLLRDALRWWVQEYQVDGFCLVNAENLTQV